jgi:hypothetical protein
MCYKSWLHYNTEVPHKTNPRIIAPGVLAISGRSSRQMGYISKWDYSESNLTQLANDIQQGMVTAVSNGSYKNDNGTSAFLVCSETVSNQIFGVNAIPGNKDEQSAYSRSKLAGASSIILTLAAMCQAKTHTRIDDHWPGCTPSNESHSWHVAPEC